MWDGGGGFGDLIFKRRIRKSTKKKENQVSDIKLI